LIIYLNAQQGSVNAGNQFGEQYFNEPMATGALHHEFLLDLLISFKRVLV
jgi:hypothetical protein